MPRDIRRPNESDSTEVAGASAPGLKSSRERILDAALEEFADKGLAGARVDVIADRVQTSKRMIYYHFKGKDELYQAVLARAYVGIRITEADAELAPLSPGEALEKIIGTSFDYHHAHPDFVRLVMNENIHRGKHMDLSTRSINHTIIETLQAILERGVRSGEFRSGIDPMQLHMTISALGFHFVSNHYTFTRAFDLDMTSDAAVAKRRKIAIETVMCWVRRPGADAGKRAPASGKGAKHRVATPKRKATSRH